MYLGLCLTSFTLGEALVNEKCGFGNCFYHPAESLISVKSIARILSGGKFAPAGECSHGEAKGLESKEAFLAGPLPVRDNSNEMRYSIFVVCLCGD